MPEIHQRKTAYDCYQRDHFPGKFSGKSILGHDMLATYLISIIRHQHQCSTVVRQRLTHFTKILEILKYQFLGQKNRENTVNNWHAKD